MDEDQLTGLFIGAGASYAVGMPLVWELTQELTGWLTPDKLRSLNASWRSQFGGYPDEVIDDFSTVLSRADIHYEAMLGYLETQHRRRRECAQHYHGLYSNIIEVVYGLLYERHVRNVQYIRKNLDLLRGIGSLAEKSKPLWVFSLNHDLIIESLAATLGIPLNSGFTDEVVSLPRRNPEGKIIGHLDAEVLPNEVLENSAMRFLRRGEIGINLLKIHGALDVFTFRDGKDLLKLRPFEPSVEGVIGALRAANDELFYPESRLPGNRLRVVNEIAYADQTGEMQFVRRSLLSGAYKFDSRRTQVLPMKMLSHFESNIGQLKSLYCIGYGFGDGHINQVFRQWLEASEDRRMVVVAPGATTVPATFLHVAPQIEMRNSTATDFLDEVAGISRSPQELAQKRLAQWVRGNGEMAKEQWQAFIKDHLGRMRARVIDWLGTLPIRDGDVDLDAVGMSQAEVEQQLKKLMPTSPQRIIEEFLAKQDSQTPLEQ